MSLPSRKFTTELAASWGVALPCRSLWTSPSRVDFSDDVLRSSPLREASCAELFTYMYRRFGMPTLGGDNYKDLCGGWMLTTASLSLVVRVRPSLSGADFSFIPYYKINALQEGDLEASRIRHIDDLRLSDEVVSELKAAYKTFLLDLLRPVGVRDSYFNALGDVDDDSNLMRSNKDGEFVYEATRHASAGYAVPSGLVGSPAWPALCTLILQAGEGDAASGSVALVARLRAPVFAEAAKESLPVKRLILLGAGADAAQLGPQLGLGEANLDRLLKECSLFYPREPSFEKSFAILDETTDEVLAIAFDFLKRLAYPSVSETVATALIEQASHLAWLDLAESCGGDFPMETVAGLLPGAEDLQKSLRASFDAGGHAALVAWLDRTVALREGKKALGWILAGLMRERALRESMRGA